MVILPRILYLFRSLPIPIRKNELLSLQNDIFRFIWNSKRSRINKRIMYLHKRVGGLSVPNLLKYYRAARIAQLTLVHTLSDPPLWVSQESDLVAPFSLPSLIWTKGSIANLVPSSAQVTLYSLSLWRAIRFKNNLQSGLSPATPLFNNPLFPPGRCLDQFRWWTQTKLTRLHDFLSSGRLLSISAFKSTYRPPVTEEFRINQIFSFWNSVIAKFRDTKYSALESLVIYTPGRPGILSFLYSILNQPLTDKLPFMLQWEEDTYQILSPEKWRICCEATSKGSWQVSLMETSLKILHRTYLVPTRLHAIYPEVSPLCFRGCDSQGTMYHIWWSCPVVRHFWTQVTGLISSVTGANCPKLPMICLIGDGPVNMSRAHFWLAQFIFLAARIHIAARWKTPTLHFPAVISRINQIMLCEKLAAIREDRVEIFENIWGPWFSSSHVPDIRYYMSI